MSVFDGAPESPSATVVPEHVPPASSCLLRFDDVAGPISRLFEDASAGEPGAPVRELEAAVGAYLGTPVVAVASAGLGMLFTLQALGLKAGERVVVPSLVPASTVQAIRYAGGVPLFADLGADLTLSATDLEALLATHPDIAMVVPSHTFGLPCNVDLLQQVVDAGSRRAGRPIFLVYDGTHGFGASWQGRLLGRSGAAEIFSLPAIHGLADVPGSLVASQQVGLLQRVKKMRDCGIDLGERVYWPGLDGQLSDLHAVVSLAGFRTFPSRLAMRQEWAKAFGARLAQTTTCTLATLPEAAPSFTFPIVLLPPHLERVHQRLREVLAAHGVGIVADASRLMHQEPRFRGFATRHLPVTEQFARRMLVCPSRLSLAEGSIEALVAVLAEAEHLLARATHLPTAPTGTV